MGNQPPSFADDMIDELRERLRDRNVEPDIFAFGAAWWGRVMEGAENELFQNLSRDNPLDWERIRKDIVISGFGDALAYVGPPSSPSVVYDDIHAIIGQALEGLTADLDKPTKTPLIIMAHSLGCAIVSNYVWDAQHGRFPRTAKGPLSRCKTLLGVITFGCNLPLFTLAYNKSDIRPITIPGDQVDSCFPNATRAEVRKVTKWLNFYDPDDILGYPLRPINRAYSAAVTEDIAIDTGTILGAHTDYWTDNDFTKPVAGYLAEVGRLAVE
jgi:hypothetical protein